MYLVEAYALKDLVMCSQDEYTTIKAVPVVGELFTGVNPALVDIEQDYYTSNIQEVVPVEETPPVYSSPEYFPVNPEQMERGTEDNTQPPKYEESTPATCDTEAGYNPYDVAINAIALTDAWVENGSNTNITALWDEIGYVGSNFADSTAWCAVFVGATLKRSKCKYIKTASSQAYKNYGIEVSLDKIKLGDVVVFFRKGKNSGFGHVGFYAGSHTETTIDILGGNQGDNLTVKTFKLANESRGWGLRSIRRPIQCNSVDTPTNDANNPAYASMGEGGSVV